MFTRFTFSLLLTLAFFASSTEMFGQRSRKANAGASKEVPAAASAAGGLTVTVPDFGALEASRGPALVTVTVKGGKAPYTALIEPPNEAVTLEAVADKPDQFRLVVEPAEAGGITFKLKVSDSSEPKVEGESAEVIVRVVEKKTNLDDLEARLQSLEIKAEAIKALFSGPARREQVVDLQKQVKDLSEQVSAVLSLLKYGAIGAFILFVVFLGLSLIKNKGKGSVKGAASHAVALLLLFGVVDARAAGTKVTCGDPEYNANFFPADGKEYQVVCKGVQGTKVEIDDTNITVTDVKSVAGGVSFKIKAASGAALDYPDMKIDGKPVEASLEIVSESTFVERDRALTSIKQMRGGNGGGGEKLFKAFLLGLAQEHRLDYNNLLQLLSSPKPGTSKEAVGAIEQARKTATIESVYRDDRYAVLKAKADALQARADALEMKVGGMGNLSEDRVKELASEVVEPTALNLGKLAGETVKLAEAVEMLGNATQVVVPAKKRMFARDIPAQVAPVSAEAATKAAAVKIEIPTWNLTVTKK